MSHEVSQEHEGAGEEADAEHRAAGVVATDGPRQLLHLGPYLCTAEQHTPDVDTPLSARASQTATTAPQRSAPAQTQQREGPTMSEVEDEEAATEGGGEVWVCGPTRAPPVS